MFWAFLISLLNFIPTIGALLGTLLPTIFCLLQFPDDFTFALSILLIVGGMLLIIGNFIEPKWLGNSMNISPLVKYTFISFWDTLGTIGMVISVPLSVVVVIILSQFESTKSIAILLSEKGGNQ